MDDQQLTLVAETTPATPPSGAPKTTTIALDAGAETVHLPAGIDTSHPVQIGNDLEFIQPDGSIILIPNGAVAGLVIFVGDIEIPADAVAALFSANNITPAEGPGGAAGGAHGNYDDPGPKGIGESFGLTDLLTPNALSFDAGTQDETTPNTPPIFRGPIFAVVAEEAFPVIGNEDPDGNTDTLGATTVYHGNMGGFDADGNPLLYSLTPPPAGALSSDGFAVDTWVGSGTNNLTGYNSNGDKVLNISIDNATGNFTVTLFQAVDQPNDTTTATPEDAISIVFGATVQDVPAGATAHTTFTLTIEDDSAVITPFTPGPNLIVNGTFVDGFTSNGDIWGHGSGVGTNVPGWTIVQTDGNGPNELERLGNDYVPLQLHSSTGGYMVDLEATPGDIEISQTVAGVVEGQPYELTFEVGRPSYAPVGSTIVEVYFNGELVDRIDPNLAMTTYNYTVVGGSGANVLSFREVGSPEEGFGTYLANVSLHASNAFTVDEDALAGGNAGGDGDVAGATNIASGSLNIAWGADNFNDNVDGGIVGAPVNGDRAVTFAANVVTTLEAQNLQSHGIDLDYVVSANGTLLTAYRTQGGHYFDASGNQSDLAHAAVFTVALSDQDAGSFKFTLLGTIDHPTTSTEDNVNLTIDFVATDSDQDPTRGSFTVAINDDMPVATGLTFSGTADEDDLADFVPPPLYPLIEDFWQGSLGTSPYDGTAPDDSHTGLLGTVPVWGNLASLVKPGADGAGQFQLVSTADAETWLATAGANGHELKSHGDVVNDARDITIPGVGEAMGFFASDGRLVFGVFVGEDGVYNFRLFDQLDHPQGDNPATSAPEAVQDILTLDFSKLVTYSDFDGDTIGFGNGTITIKVVDDVPEAIGTETGTADEDDLADFNPIYPAVFDFWQGSLGTSPYDTAVPDGSVTGLLGTVPVWGFLGDNVKGGADEFGKFALLSESDANTLLASFNGGKPLESHGDAIDHTQAITIPGLGDAMGFFASDGRLVFGLFVDEHTGVFNFRLFDQLDHPLTDNPDTDVVETAYEDTLSLNLGKFVTYTDRDGDKIDFHNVLNINVVDDIPQLHGAVKVTLSEADLSNFSPLLAGVLHLFPSAFEALPSIVSIVGSDGTNQDPSGLLDSILGTTSKSGFLDEIIGTNVVIGGADEFGKFALVDDPTATGLLDGLNLSSDGSPVTRVESLDLPVLGKIMGFFAEDGRLIMTLTVGEAGNYDIRLFDQVDHPLTNDPSTDALETSFQDTLTLDLGHFVTYTDYDGDKIDLGTGHLVLDIVDDTPQATDAQVIGTVEEEDGTLSLSSLLSKIGININIPGLGDDMGHGNEDTTSNTSPNLDIDALGDMDARANYATGSLSSLVTVGADEEGAFSFAAGLKGTNVQTSGGANVTSRGQNVLFDVTSLGGVPVLIGYVENAGGNGYQAGDRLVFSLTLTDLNLLDPASYDPADGYTNNLFTFIQHDQLDEPAPASGATEDMITLDLSKTIVFTDADGDKIGLGDQSLLIQSIDDVPVQVAGATVVGIVEEEQLAGGNDDLTPDPEDGDFNFIVDFKGITTETATGNLASLVKVGADEVGTTLSLQPPFIVPVGTFSLNSDTSGLTALNLTSNQHALSYTVVGNTLTAYVDNGDGSFSAADAKVFTLILSSNGDYTFKLIDQLDHANSTTPHAESEDILAVDLSSVIHFSDRDGDTIGLSNGTFTIKVIDDMPINADFAIHNVDTQSGAGTQNTTLMLDETAGVQSTAADSDEPGDKTLEHDVATLPGVFAGVAALTGLTGYAYASRDGAVTITPHYGADLPGALAVSLTQSSGSAFSGQDSGLLDAQSNLKIFLFTDSSGIVLGRMGADATAAASGTIVFAVGATLSGNDVTLSMVEYRGVEHPIAGDRDDTILLDKIYVTATQTDADGDQLSNTSGSPALIRIEDDGPTLSVAQVDGGYGNLTIELDETIGADRYNTGESEDAGGNTNTDDLAGVLARVTTNIAGGLASFFSAPFSYGADGAGSVVGSFAFSGIPTAGLQTNLSATHGGAIVLKLVGADLVGIDGAGDTVFTIKIVQPTPGTYQLETTLNEALNHGADNNNFDSELLLKTISGSVGLTYTVTVTDGDNDPVTQQATLPLVTSSASPFSFDDDGPKLAVTGVGGFSNGLFFDGFVPNGNTWGQGSGTNSTGTAGAWSIQPSTVEPASSVQLERVGDGYRGADSPSNSTMVDLEASPGNVQVSQTLHGLTAGEQYHITFEIGAGTANPGDLANTAVLQVLWNGGVVGLYNPTTGAMQIEAVDVVAVGGDNTLTFREVGDAGDNTGTFLANVRVTDVISIDETAGLQGDEVANLSALFSAVGTKGVDPNMLTQYAQGAHAILTATPDYGSDGAAAVNPLVYSFTLPVPGGDSGLATTEGNQIVLSVESGMVVGRVVGGAHNGEAAFALAVDPATGVVSVAQYLSLHHPDSSAGDEAIYLGPNTVSVTVTATDGDGDHISQTTDVSGLVGFHDDGPTATSAVLAHEVFEDDLPNGTGDSSGDRNGDGGGNDARYIGNLTSLVDFGADGPGGFIVETTNLAPELLALTSGGHSLQYSIGADNTLLAKDGNTTIFTFQVDPASGQYLFTLLGPLDQSSGVEIHGHEVPLASINTVGSTYAVAEISGNSLAFEGRLPNGDAIIKVTNDGNSAVSWTLDNTSGGVDYPLNIPAHTSIFVNVGPFSTPPNVSFDLSGAGANGHTEVNNGHGTFQLVGSDDALTLDMSTAVTARDGDGDTVALHDQLFITVNDDAPVAGTPIVGSVSEAELPLVSISAQSLAIDFGADGQGPGVLTFATDGGGHPQHPAGLTSDGVPLAYALETLPSGEQQIVAYKSGETVSEPVFIATLNSPVNPTYIFTLFQNVDHAIGSNPLQVSFTVNGTDGDGDPVAQTFSVNIADGVPTIGATTAGDVSEDGPRTLTDVPLTINWGSDDAAGGDRSLAFTNTTVSVKDPAGNAVALSSSGQAVSIGFIGNVLVGYIGAGVPGATNDARIVFFASLSDATGTYDFTLKQPLDHAAPVNGTDYLDLGFNITATDFDGDPAMGSFTVRVDAAGTIGSIEYDTESTGVFVNLDGSAHTFNGQTVGAGTATDVTGQGPVIGIDNVAGILDAHGGSGDDVLVGSSSADYTARNTLVGGGGQDLLVVVPDIVVPNGFDTALRTFDHGDGTSEQVSIVGLAGEGDALHGGVGYDTVRFDLDGTSATGFVFDRASFPGSLELDGVEQFIGTDGNDVLMLPTNYTTDGSGVTVNGGKGDDVISGSNNVEALFGGEGNDKISGLGGNDTIHGNSGDDTIWGGDGNDTIYGDFGDDTIYGGAGDDTLSGDNGNDAFIYKLGDGHDTVDGGAGTSDRINVNGNNGNQSFVLTSTATGFTVETDGDSIPEVTATNVEKANLALAGGHDAVSIVDRGSDTIILSGATGDLTVTGANLPTTRILNTANLDLTVAGGTGGDTIDASAVTTGAATVNLTLDGGSGNDTLVGSGAADIIIGGADSDTITGGRGDDVIQAGSGDDRILYTVGDGNDRVDGGSDSGGPGPDYDILQIQGDATARIFTVGKISGGAEIDPHVLDASAIDATDLFVSYDGPGAGSVRADEVERVKFVLNAGDSIVFGDTSGTGLASNTILVTSGGGDNTYDFRGYAGISTVVLNDTDGVEANDTDLVQLAGKWADWTITNDGTYFVLSKDGITIQAQNIENFFFQGENDGAGATIPASQLIEQAPVIDDVAFTIAENSAAGTIVGLAGGADGNGNIDPVHYSFVGGSGTGNTTSADGKFVIDAASGQITVASGAVLDYEATHSLVEAVRLTDSRGQYDDAQVNINLTNVNEPPVLTPVDNAGSVTEDQLQYGYLQDNGSFLVSDPENNTPVDIDYSFVGAVGSNGLTISSQLLTDLGDAFFAYKWGNEADWAFFLENNKIAFLNGGDSITATYHVTATDSLGASTTRDVTVVINGATNVPPHIESAVALGTVTEDLSYAAPTTEQIANGGFETNNTNGWTITPPSMPYNSYITGGGHSSTHALTVTTNNYTQPYHLSQTINTVAGVHYTVSFWAVGINAQGNTNDLVAKWNGQTIVALHNENDLSYSDFHHYTADVVGQAGSSVLDFALNSGQWWVLDDISVTAAVTPGVETSNGSIFFSDVNLTDTHGVTYQPVGSGYYGSFAVNVSDPATGDGSGTVRWSFSVNDADIQALKGGEVVKQYYDVTIADSGSPTGTATQRVEVDIVGVNDAPVAKADTGAVAEDATLNVTAANGVLRGATGGSAADTDADDSTSTLLVSGVVAGTGTVTQGAGVGSVIEGTYGHLTLSSDGSYTYVADKANSLAAGVTAVDTFTYTDKDPSGAVSNATTLKITVTGTDDPGVISGTTSGTIRETGGISNSQSDPVYGAARGDLSFVDPDGPGGWQADSSNTANGYGWFTITAAGHWEYGLYNNSPTIEALKEDQHLADSFTVYTADGKPQVITIDILGNNDGPTVQNALANQSSAEDQPFSFTIPANTFADVDGRLDGTANPLILTATLSDANSDFNPLPSWLIFDPATGTFSGTPPQDFNGSIKVNVIASDGDFSTVGTPNIFTLSITPVNDKPVLDLDANDSSLKTGADYQTTYSLGGSAKAIADTDSSVTDVDNANVSSATITLTNAKTGDALNFSASTLNALGITTHALDTSVPGQITLTLGGSAPKASYETAIESITFSTTGTNTTDRSITVTVTDGSLSSSTATSTIHVASGNHAPDAVDDTLSFGGAGGTPPTGDGWVQWHTGTGHNDHYYKAVYGNYSWSEALAAAEAEAPGAYLVTITSAQENAFVQGLAPSYYQYSWMSASDHASEGTWRWVAGPEAGQLVSYTNWNTGEPNNWDGDEDYAQITRVFGGGWNDANGDDVPSWDVSDYVGYVAEWGGSGGNGGVSEDVSTVFSKSLLLSNDTDADHDTLDILSIASTSAKGASISYDSATGQITYNPTGSATLQALASGASTTDTFTYTISDGHGGTDTATATITINGVDTAPSITNLNALSYFENEAPRLIDTNVTVSDADSANFNGGSLTVQFSANGTTADQLGIGPGFLAGNGQINVNGGNLVYTPLGQGSVNIGTVSGGANGAPLVFNFTSDLVTAALAEAVIENVTYFNSSDNPSTATRTVSFALNDGDGGVGTGSANINITAVNDAPTSVASLTLISNWGGTLFTVPDAAFLAFGSDAEGDALSIASISQSTANFTTLSHSGTTITVDDNSTPGGTFTYAVTDGIAIQGPLAGTYQQVSGTTVTGTSGNDIIVGNNSASTLDGAAGADVILGGTAGDTIIADQNDLMIDGGTGTDTLQVGSNFTSTSNGQIANIENVKVTAPGLTLDLSNQTEGFKITAAPGGGTINAGSGADVVVINAGSTTGKTWAVDLGTGSVDKIVFNHDGLSISDNTVATVTHFTGGSGGDKLAVTLGGAEISSGFQAIGTNGTDVSSAGRVLVITTATSASLTDDSAGGAIETIIANAIDDIVQGNYTVVVYSGASGSVNAGIYTMNVPTTISGTGSSSSKDLSTSGFSIEHIMTLSAVAYGSLVASNFATSTDPVILDLDHNGYAFSSLDHGVSFDINADGQKDQVAWNTSNDGILAMDVNGDGKIDSGKEIFTPDFNGGHFASGSAALASLDSNHDGVIDGNDVDFSKLLVWQDANADGVSDAGELATLADHNIASISAPGTPTDDVIDGQSVTATGSFTLTDGTTGSYIEAALDTSFGGPAPLLDDATSVDWDSVVVGTPDTIDTLQGTAGADKFTLTDLHAVDFIADYNFEQGDAVDLSAILGSGSGASKENAADYVQYDSSTGHLSVDTDGAANGANFVDVAVLNQPIADVRVILDDGVDVTINHLG